MIVYIFTVAPCISITLSKKKCGIYVKVHFYDPNIQKFTVNEKKNIDSSSSFQINLRVKTKLYIQLTVDGLGKHIESKQREKSFLIHSEK